MGSGRIYQFSNVLIISIVSQILSNFRASHGLCTAAELIISTEFHMVVHTGSVRVMPLNKSGVAVLLLA